MAFSLDELNNLDANDLKNIGTAPGIVKGIIILLLCIIVAVAGYFLVITPKMEELAKIEKEENNLRTVFDEKAAKAANLEAYKQQLDEMRQSFGALLRQLPNKTEIETLLTDISQTGISSGLEIELFKPEGLIPKDFYAEYPIKLRVTGRYHQFAQFVSGVAALPRIVTLQNIQIEPADKDGGVKLAMELTAVTYQYLDETEEVEAQ